MSFKARSRYVARIALLAALFFAVSLLTFLLLPNRVVYRSEYRAGTRAIKSLEAYHLHNRHYPETLESIDPEAARTIYYRKEAEDAYILWFGASLGESIIYDSRRHSWSD